jgi:hypothetical protein
MPGCIHALHQFLMQKQRLDAHTPPAPIWLLRRLLYKMKQMGSVLLKNCFFVQPSADTEGLRGNDILIEGQEIRRIGPSISAPPGARVIDCSHHHFLQTLTRNLPAVQDAMLFDWLVEAIHVSSPWASC